MDYSPLIRAEIVEERIYLITLCNPPSLTVFSWGTKVSEHRLNPPLLDLLNHALDKAESLPNISCLVVMGEGNFFSNGLDLNYIATVSSSKAGEFQKQAELFLARMLSFPLPTVAAINGHFCAAGAMLGLAFDFRIMNRNRGLFFVPGVDIGLAYTPGMTQLLKSKLPTFMHTEMIVFATKYRAEDLERERVVLKAVSSDQVLSSALSHARELTAQGRFQGEAYRNTLQRIKENTFQDALLALRSKEVFPMGFESRLWDKKKSNL